MYNFEPDARSKIESAHPKEEANAVFLYTLGHLFPIFIRGVDCIIDVDIISVTSCQSFERSSVVFTLRDYHIISEMASPDIRCSI